MIVALCVLVGVAIAGGSYVCVVALNAQRDALEQVTGLANDQAKRDADERHVLADRLQHPEIARPFRTPAPPPAQPAQTFGLGLAGIDVSDMSEEDLVREFGEDFVNGKR